MSIDASTQSYIDYMLQQRQDEWEALCEIRDYADGNQAAQLTEEQIELLVGEDGDDPEFAINICEPILEAEANRLAVANIDVIVPEDVASQSEELSEKLTKLAREWWKRARMDEGQQNAFWSAVRDGNSHLILDYDHDMQMPTLAVNKAYDGESSGVTMLYEDDNPTKPIAGVKIWTIAEPSGSSETKIRRKNIYYSDRIEKWIADSSLTSSYAEAGWRPLRYGDDDWSEDLDEVPPVYAYTASEYATVGWWTDTKKQGGIPLGIPIAHLRRGGKGEAYGRSAIAQVVPGLQDAVNLSGVSLMAASLLSGFKAVVLFGYDGAEDKLHLYPGALITSSASDGSVAQLQETDLKQLIEVKNTFIRDAAMITHTPLSFFNLSGDIPAEGTQKQLEAGLLSKIGRNQVAFGNAIEDAVRMMFKLEVVEGQSVGLPLDLIDRLEINCEWEPAETRNDREVVELAVQKHNDLKTPLAQAWREVGYNEEQIAQFEQEQDIKRNQAMGQLAGMVQQAEAENDKQVELARIAQGGNNGAAQPEPN